MPMRGLRGATTAAENTKDAIWQAAQQMLRELLERNGLSPEDIGAAIFSMTEDLTAAFPSAGARRLPGFDMVPLFDARQCAVEESLPLCIRVLLLVDTERTQQEMKHVYLGAASGLRPDLTNK